MTGPEDIPQDDRYHDAPDEPTADDQLQQQSIMPTRTGAIGAISPTTLRNFISLVNTNSSIAKRGESQPGFFYSRNLGTLPTVTAEVVGCFYRQRYQLWDERSQVFRTYCEATANTIDALVGKGRPGGKCTECNLTEWRQVAIEGTDETKNQPPQCNEHVVFELFIHDVAAPAFWDISTIDNLNSIRNTINILNEKFGWGQYVIEIYSSSHANSRGEARYSPHIKLRHDLQAFNSRSVIEGDSHIVDLNADTALAPAQPGNPQPSQFNPNEPWLDSDDLPF